jgi:penicillin G amidase
MSHRLGALVLALLLVAGVQVPLASSHAAPCGEVVGSGAQQARICRDAQYAVPSVYASHMAGVWYGTGWAQAEDRLFQIDLVRRNARGTLAELFGSLDSSTIQSDEQTATFFYTAAELQHQYDQLPPFEQQGVTNFVDGLNAYVSYIYATPAREAALVPYQFWVVGALLGENVYKPPPFTVLDVVANGAVLAREFGGGGGDELSNLSFLQFLQAKYGAKQGYALFNDARWVDDPTAPVTVPDGRPQYGIAGSSTNPVPPAPGFLTPIPGVKGARNDPPAAVVAAGARARSRQQALLESIGTRYQVPWHDGSNAFVVSPKKTTNGHTFLWGAPQEGFGSPSIDWEVYQHGPNFDVGGFTIPLAPVILIGHNRDIAFTTTSEETVDQQIYQETVDFKSNPPTYLFNGKHLPMQATTHVIKVAGQPDQNFVTYRTVHGPVFFTDPAHGIAYSMKFASFGQEWQTFVGFALQSTAKNLDDYRHAMEHIATLHNYFYADRYGNIAYFGAGLVPILKPCPNLTVPQPCDPRLPHAGDGSQEWQGIVPFDYMPHSINPPQGYLLNWNTKPSRAHFLQQNGGEEYWGTMYRSESIARDLASKAKLSPAEMTAIEADIGTIDDADSRPTAPYLLPYLFDAYAHAPSLHTPRRDQAIAELKAWDEKTTTGSVAMSIYTQWTQALVQRMFGPNGAVPFADATQNFTSKATFNLVLHVLAHTHGIVPCNTLCASVNYLGNDRNGLLVGALDDALALLSGTSVLPGTHGATGFGTTAITKWGWVPAQNEDWAADLDPVANTAVSLGLLHKPDLGTSPTQNRSTWMQAIDLSVPSGISGVAVLPPGESGFISKDGTFSPHFADQVGLFNAFEYKPMQ